MLTINEFVERYGIGRTKTYEEINAGRLTAVKCGSRTLIPITSAEKWLNSLPLIQLRIPRFKELPTTKRTFGCFKYRISFYPQVFCNKNLCHWIARGFQIFETWVFQINQMHSIGLTTPFMFELHTKLRFLFGLRNLSSFHCFFF